MATVLKARERSLDRHVALKTLPHDSLRLSNFAERFEREAKIVARLEHPNIVPIFGYGITEGIPWMAMRYISGGSVAGLIRNGTLEPRRVSRIVHDVAEALDYAHERAILHRDVKPQNMLLDESGRAYLTDFGIARIMAGHPRLTGVGSVAGTPEYMAPEQATGTEPDLRLDVYALGTVAYQMLTGRTPFGGEAPMTVLRRQVSEPVPLEPLAPYAEAIREAVLRCLAKDPGERWKRAGAFATAFAAAVSVPAVAAALSPEPPPVPTKAPAAREADEPTVMVTSASRPSLPTGSEPTVIAPSAASLQPPAPTAESDAFAASPPRPMTGPGYDPTLIAPKPVVQAPPPAPSPPAAPRPASAPASRPPTAPTATRPPAPVPRAVSVPPTAASGARPGLTAAHFAIIVLTALFGLGLLGLASYLVLRVARPGTSLSSPAPPPPAR
jgi:serine/threonine protein kinase